MSFIPDGKAEFSAAIASDFSVTSFFEQSF